MIAQIRALPMTYRGVRFRSTLEARYAALFDQISWRWSYEPIAVRLTASGLAYLCDFWLPHQNVWVEVKGPHGIRLDRPDALQRALGVPADSREPLVVVMRAPTEGRIVYHAATPLQQINLGVCDHCDSYSFVDLNSGWICRTCWQASEMLSFPSDVLLPVIERAAAS